MGDRTVRVHLEYEGPLTSWAELRRSRMAAVRGMAYRGS